MQLRERHEGNRELAAGNEKLTLVLKRMVPSEKNGHYVRVRQKRRHRDGSRSVKPS